MTDIFTIGYEGSDVTQLIETLKTMEISVLADVRELPLSRKKGLSKRGLSSLLAEHGIEYKHYKELGDPKEGRDAARSGDFRTFRRVFGNHIRTKAARDAMAHLFETAREKKTCMMCFERCAKNCHRSIIADFALKKGFNVFNLVADRPQEYARNDIKIPRHNPYQSLAAAE